MKKLLALVLAFLMLVPCAVTVTAAENPTLTVTTDSGKAGDTVTIDVVVDPNPGLGAVQFFLEYDDSVLTCTNSVANAAFGGTGTVSPNTAPGLAWFNVGDITTQGTIVTYTFVISDNAEPGTYPINLYDVITANTNEDMYDTVIIAGSVTVECNHQYSEWAEANADSHKRICSLCNNEETLPHSWDNGVVTTDPTCAKPGVTTYTCADCGATKTDDTTPPVTDKHTYGAWTNYDEAQHMHVCSVCEDTVYAAHNWSEPVLSDGFNVYTCADCGATKSEDAGAMDVSLVFEGRALVGKTITVDMVLSNNSGLASVAGDFKFDTSVLKLVDMSIGDFGGMLTFDPERAATSFSWFNASNITTNGVFATLTFEVLAEAEPGQYVITMEYDADNFSNDSYETIPVNFRPVTIGVYDYIPGDINGDQSVNMKDVILLAQYHAKWSVTVNEPALDVNGDGSYNMKDVIRLAQYNAKWDVELH